MKRVLKILLILLLCCGLVGGGIALYAYLTARKPVATESAGNWMLHYSPDETWHYGIVASNSAEEILQDKDRKVLELFVAQGDTVKVGDPLLRYDTSRDSLTMEQKKLELEKLYGKLKEDYKQYNQYAHKTYVPQVASPTPALTPASAAPVAAVRLPLQAVPLALHTGQLANVAGPNGGAGTAGNPFQYSMKDGDPVSNDFLTELITMASENGVAVHANLRGEKTQVSIVAGTDGSLSVTIQVEKAGGTSVLETPTAGNGTWGDPYVYRYGAGTSIPAEFIQRHLERAVTTHMDVYATLNNPLFLTSFRFGADGSTAFYLQLIPPTPTPSPSPTPDPNATPDPDATPEPVIPWFGGGLSAEQREEIVAECLNTIHKDELQYRQLLLDIQKLESSGSGILYAQIDGTVSQLSDPETTRAGEVLITIRGGSGLYIGCLIGELELDSFTPGMEMTGFSYEAGREVTCIVTDISTMPVTERYSNGGNPNSSGYLMKLELAGSYTPSIGEYIEFGSSMGSVTAEDGATYLYEAFVQEQGGQAYIYVARDGILRKEAVRTGRRAYSYVEITGTSLTMEDRIAFPGDPRCRDGARVELPQDE